MRTLSRLAVVLTAYFTSAFALQFSAPSSGSSIDPTNPFLISWSVSYTDPGSIDLKLSNADTDPDITIASGVVAYTGTYTVSAGTIKASGSGYTLVAVGNGGSILAM